MSSLPSGRYRSDVDGLRAIAVMLVAIFHGFPEAIPGGFIGVDIFFVISGFLITGIIARELDAEGRFSLLGFYQRRVRRIFPALILMLCAVMVLGWLWMLPAPYAALSRDAAASAAFSANIALLLQSGYFDIESARKPLLHLWSLGIEEQFYLVWPLVLMLAARLRWRLLRLAATIGIASFALNVALIGANPVATFYLPFPRAWELLVGAVLACAWDRLDQREAAADRRAGLGLALIVAAAAVLTVHRAFPGWWALMPVAGSALLLSAPAARINRVLLSWPPMVWIGLVSYPLYLWHWPLLVLFATIKFRPLTLIETGLVLVLSGLLAFATYRFVEKPLRFGGPAAVKAAGLAGAMALVALAGVVVFEARGFDFRLPAEIRAMADVPQQTAQLRVHTCMLDLGHETAFADACIDRKRPLLLVWGDSTAGALMPGLRHAQASRDFGIAQLTASSCIPTLDAEVPSTPGCRANNDRVLALARQFKPDTILLHGNWGWGMGGDLEKTVATLRQQTGARVVVLGPVVLWKRGLPNEVLRHYLLHHELIPARSQAGLWTRGIDGELRKAATSGGGEFISAGGVLCNEQGCLTRLGDAASDITSSDGVHLTEKASVFLVAGIIDRVLGAPATRANASHTPDAAVIRDDASRPDPK